MTTSPDISEIKQRLTIPDLWAVLALPGDSPSGNCVIRSPFREDRSPSLSIFAEGSKWKDHGTGDGGDVIDFYAQARRLPMRDAIRELQQHLAR